MNATISSETPSVASDGPMTPAISIATVVRDHSCRGVDDGTVAECDEGARV
jgi:hypothetical protein